MKAWICIMVGIPGVSLGAFVPPLEQHRPRSLRGGPSWFSPQQSLLHSKQQQQQLFAERKPFITGNWKLNPETKQEAVALANGVVDAIKNKDSDVAIFVPFPFLDAVKDVVGGKVIVGAQCIVPEVSGAFTGGISPGMLKSLGVNWVLAGHSERREIFKESDAFINAQCRLLIQNDMNVVLCIGETLGEYEQNLAQYVCEVQLKKALAGISAAQVLSRVTIAYEPVWAIGTGKVATPEIAQTTHSAIRATLTDLFGAKVADRIRILYGGSVGPDSVDSLLAQPDVDGALVGSASLDVNKFQRIINFQSAAVPA